MKKLRLNVDALHVESFRTDPVPAPGGTVNAHATSYGTCQGTCVDTCGGPTCDAPCETADTCYLTCMAACGWTYGQVVCKQVTQAC